MIWLSSFVPHSSTPAVPSDFFFTKMKEGDAKIETQLTNIDRLSLAL